jgi:hypothetical protein
VSETDWNEFAARLARRLARMSKRQHLVLMLRPFPPYDGPSMDPNHYVQFAHGGEDGLLAEAVSNRYLTGVATLDAHAERRLIELGWQPPGTGTWGPRWDASNYWRIWEPPVPTGEAAMLAVVTFEEVYWAERPSDLVYRAGHPEGRPFSWPDLGLEPGGEGAA